MDHNETTPETTEDFNLAKVIVTEFAKSTAVSAGVIVAFVAVGSAALKLKELKEARKAKKNANIEN